MKTKIEDKKFCSKQYTTMQRNQSQLQNLFIKYLENQVFDRAPHSLYAPVAYFMTLGGKRLRPLLALMGCEMFGRPAEAALPAAMAVEVFHNFSLVHDDIMDEAPLRRGMPTVHEKYSANTAILSGDAMLIESYHFLCQSPADASLSRLMHIFNQTALEVCEGQAADMDFETRDDVSLPEYLRMIEQKTAALIGGALALGAVIGGAGEEDTAHLDAFGRNIGIAFQIQDDLLDTYGDPAKFGKQVGGDILQNKKTLLVLRTLEMASDADRAELAHWMQTGAENAEQKVAAVRAIFDRNNIPAWIMEEKQRFQIEAFRHLEAVNVTTERKAVLRGFLEDLLVREA